MISHLCRVSEGGEVWIRVCSSSKAPFPASNSITKNSEKASVSADSGNPSRRKSKPSVQKFVGEKNDRAAVVASPKRVPIRKKVAQPSDSEISIDNVVVDFVEYINKKGECASDSSLQINAKRLNEFYKVDSRRKEVIRKQARRKKG